MEHKVTALICRPGQSPVVETVSDRFEEWQRLVKDVGQSRGFVQIVPLYGGIYMICNEDGKRLCPFNRRVPGLAPDIDESEYDLIVKPDHAAAPGTIGTHEVYGTFALVRDGHQEKRASLTQDDIERWMAALEWVEKNVSSSAR
jgi:hypothetical protein